MNKRELFLKIVKLEFYRARGAYWKDILYGYLSINTIKDAIVVGGIAKLTIFQNLPLWTLFGVLFIGGLLIEFVKMLVGWIDFKYGLRAIEAEWNQKNEKLAPFNNELKQQLTEIANKIGAKVTFKDYDH